MSFSDTYKKLKPSVVAIVSRISKRPDFPDIIGTGFIAHSDGVIVTNNHVVEAINKLPRRKGAPPEEWPISVLFLHDIPDKGMAHIFFDVEGVAKLGREKPAEGHHYGPDIPDVGLIYVKARGLPSLDIETSFNLEEGEEVFISGYPLGTRTLRAPGWIHQINPVLQRGIVGAIQPFPCKKPHGLLIDVMAQHGSSGSPIFSPKSNKVTGLLYGGILDQKENGTSLTLAIPAYIVSDILRIAEGALTDRETDKVIKRDVSKHLTLEKMLKTLPMLINTPKGISKGSQSVPRSEIEFTTSK